MYNTKAFSLKIAQKKNRKKKTSRCPRWRRLFCSLRSVLSYCQKAFLNLSRMRVPILEIRTRFVSWAMRYRCYTAWCPSELSYLQDASGNAETHFPFVSPFRRFLISPLVPDTKGVNEPISTSSTRCWYLRFFSPSCSLNTSNVVLFW